MISRMRGSGPRSGPALILFWPQRGLLVSILVNLRHCDEQDLVGLRIPLSLEVILSSHLENLLVRIDMVISGTC